MIFFAKNTVNEYLRINSTLINILKITMPFKKSRNQQKSHCNALRQSTNTVKKMEKNNDPPHQCEFNKIP